MTWIQRNFAWHHHLTPAAAASCTCCTCHSVRLQDLNDWALSTHTQIPEGFTIKSVVTADQLAYNVPHSVYIALSIDPELSDVSLLSATFTAATLKYTVKDCDPNTSQVLDDEGYAHNAADLPV